MDLVHQKKFQRVWEKGNYRMGSTAQRLLPFLLKNIPEAATVNDYGCGTGRMEVALHKVRPEQSVVMIDIALNAVEKAAHELIESDCPVAFRCLDLADLGNLKRADWGICINTLMTVQPDKLERIISEIRRTCDNLIFEAYDFSDIRLGSDLTTVKKDATEWHKALSKYWDEVFFYRSPESKQRYIFVCRSYSIVDLKGKYSGQDCYLVGRGPSLLRVKEEHFGKGPVIVINEAIQNIVKFNLSNDVYSQWRSGDVIPDIEDYLRVGDTLLLCDDPVRDIRVKGGVLPPASVFCPNYSPRYVFNCKKHLNLEPQEAFSHLCAVEIALLFGCKKIVNIGFDSYRGDMRTVLKDDFVQSEYHQGDYADQISVVKKRLKNIPHEWVFA